MTVRRLIVNADDFGLSPGVNRGILHGHQQGLITSASLMANADAFADAAALALTAPTLSIGCHVTLTSAVPAFPANELPALAPNGRMRPSPAGFLQRAVRGRIPAAELAAEMAAQIRRIQTTGIRVTHVDTHQHLHLFPAVLRPLLEAARGCGIRAVRNPFTPLQPMAFAHMRRPTRSASAALFPPRPVESFRRAVADAGMTSTDGTLILFRPSVRLLDSILACLPEGTWELVCHPGYCDAGLGRVKTRLREGRARELELLTSDSARDGIARHGIELIPYRDLVPANSESLPPPPTSKAGRSPGLMQDRA
jgi:predicted glycoside hydrolase/deacetylase ChbG (UPF0249 family)